MVFACILGVALLIMAIVVAGHYIAVSYYQLAQFTGADNIAVMPFAWIFISVLFGGVFLCFGAIFLAIGTPNSLDQMLENSAYRILSIDQFEEEGKKHLLVVPLKKENAEPCYFRLDSNNVPESAIVGRVIIKVNGKLEVLTREELPIPEMEKLDEG